MTVVINGTTGIDKVDSGSDVYTADRTFTGSQRGAVLTDNDISFDMNVSNNFLCTPTASGALTFTNIVAGQSGNITLVNSGGYTITRAATVKANSTFNALVTAAGTYWISYFSPDGTNVYCAASGPQT